MLRSVKTVEAGSVLFTAFETVVAHLERSSCDGDNKERSVREPYVT